MKRLLLTSSIFLTSSVMAHEEGIHGHPHGVESYLALCGILFVAVLVGIGLRMAKNQK